MVGIKQSAAHIAIIFSIWFLFSPDCSKAGDYSKGYLDSLKGGLSHARTGWDVDEYELKINLQLPAKSISGISIIKFTATDTISYFQIDLAAQFQVQGIKFLNEWLKPVRIGDHMFVKTPVVLDSGAIGNFEVIYSGKPRQAVKPPWDGGFIWSKDSMGRPWVAVACEGLGASSWWPCKDHPSDEPKRFKFSCRLPKEMTCISNGNNTNVFEMGNGEVEYQWQVDNPINLYNITFYAGSYKHIQDIYYGDYGPLALDYYLMDYSMEAGKKAFQAVRPMIRSFENHFGKYPFYADGYALVEAPYWGMEHQSAVAYGNGFKVNAYGFDFILIHESGHEWFGNSISAADHGMLWLHESFTTYAESIFLEDMKGEDTAIKYLMMQKKLIHNQSPMLGPLGVAYNGYPDNDIYYKGSWLLHTLRHQVNNDSLWFACLKAYGNRFYHQVITTEDALLFVDSFLSKNYEPMMMDYLSHGGLPVLLYHQQIKGTKTKLMLKLKPAGGLIYSLRIPQPDGDILEVGPNWKKVKGNSPLDLEYLHKRILISTLEVGEKP